MPPPIDSTKDDQSTLTMSGWCAKALNKVFTAGNEWKGWRASSLNTAGRSRGLGSRMLAPPIRRLSIMFTVNAKM